MRRRLARPTNCGSSPMSRREREKERERERKREKERDCVRVSVTERESERDRERESERESKGDRQKAREKSRNKRTTLQKRFFLSVKYTFNYNRKDLTYLQTMKGFFNL
jgi:hypothetical protein